MKISRRNVVKGIGVGTTAAAIMSFEGPRSIARAMSMALPVQERPLLLHFNENPLGPGEAVKREMNRALDLGLGSQYGLPARETAAAIARMHNVPADRVMLGNGSTQLLQTMTHVFTSPTRHLVTAAPTFETTADYAKVVGHPVVAVPLGADRRMDLDGMADAAKGGGLIFFCNPNNPTATLHEADAVGGFLDRVLSETEATVVIDEAYYDYVTNPKHATQIPLAAQNERVIVSRTFSKAHGMAGMRIGWLVAHPETVRKLSAWQYSGSLNAAALLGAQSSIEDRDHIAREVERNTAVRRFTLDWFNSRGIEATDSQTNFVFVRIGIPARAFRDGCAEHNIKVGRDFPPYENEWARISLGTMDEMQRAIEVFDQVLTNAGRPRRQEIAA